mmetsp:Transcript_36698/g.61881  ORF Transcript_36698/g.61881 Transcript_36698/m.61881 type:complete len:311 (-) Transcript_36698:1464-2396(-)
MGFSLHGPTCPKSARSAAAKCPFWNSAWMARSYGSMRKGRRHSPVGSAADARTIATATRSNGVNTFSPVMFSSHATSRLSSNSPRPIRAHFVRSLIPPVLVMLWPVFLKGQVCIMRTIFFFCSLVSAPATASPSPVNLSCSAAIAPMPDAKSSSVRYCSMLEAWYLMLYIRYARLCCTSPLPSAAAEVAAAAASVIVVTAAEVAATAVAAAAAAADVVVVAASVVAAAAAAASVEAAASAAASVEAAASVVAAAAAEIAAAAASVEAAAVDVAAAAATVVVEAAAAVSVSDSCFLFDNSAISIAVLSGSH